LPDGGGAHLWAVPVFRKKAGAGNQRPLGGVQQSGTKLKRQVQQRI